MKKIRLDVEALSVESFATAPADADEGTVRAHSDESVDVCLSVNLCIPPQSTARRASEYASCFVNCQCTNRLYVCLMPNTDV